MSRIAALALCAFVAAMPAAAQEETAPEGDMKDGIDLLEEGMRLFFKGLTDEVEPALRELAENMEPALRELMGLIEDFDAYHMPEMLPNGDIIIRRKTPLMPEEAPQGEIEI